MWTDGMKDWKPAKELPEFRAAFMKGSQKFNKKVHPEGEKVDNKAWLARHWYIDQGYSEGDIEQDATTTPVSELQGGTDNKVKIPKRNLTKCVTGDKLLELVAAGKLNKYSWVRHRTERVWVQVGQLATPNIYPSLVKRFKEQEKAEKEKGTPFLPQHNFEVIIMECKPQLP